MSWKTKDEGLFLLKNKGCPLPDARLDLEPGKKMLEMALLDSQKPEVWTTNKQYYTDQTSHISELGDYPTDTAQAWWG